MVNIVPFVLNIFLCAFPAIFVKYSGGKSGGLIMDIHFVGFLISLGTLPIIFVSEKFEVDLGQRSGINVFREIVGRRYGDQGGASHSIRKYFFF